MEYWLFDGASSAGWQRHPLRWFRPDDQSKDSGYCAQSRLIRFMFWITQWNLNGCSSARPSFEYQCQLRFDGLLAAVQITLVRADCDVIYGYGGGGKGGREGGVNGAISDDIMMIMVDYSYWKKVGVTRFSTSWGRWRRTFLTAWKTSTSPCWITCSMQALAAK